jgi:hypothetical protein
MHGPLNVKFVKRNVYGFLTLLSVNIQGIKEKALRVIFVPAVYGTEGSELEAGVVQLGRWLSSRIMRVQVTELEVCCMQYSHAVDSSTFAQF